VKNDGILPLKGQQHIAVIGRSAETPHFQGGGSSHINTTRVAMPFKELQSRAGNTELTYAEGYPKDDSFRQDLIDQAVSIAQSADVALLYIALPAFKESEGYDRRDLDLTEQQIALIKAVAKVQPKTVVVLNNGSPVVLSEWIDSVSAVLEGWMMGQAGGAAIADILFGHVNPSTLTQAANWARPSPSNLQIHPRTRISPAVQAGFITVKVCLLVIVITMQNKFQYCSRLVMG